MGQYIPLDSAVHAWDARSKIAAVAGLSLSVIMASTWYQVAGVSIIILVLLVLSRIGWNSYLKSLRLLLILTAVTALLQIVIVPGQVLFTIIGITVSREGLLAGSWLVFKVTGVLLLAAWLTFTTSPGELMAGLERLFSPLQRIRFPVQELVMMMTLSLRFLPLLVEETRQVQQAQLARGAHWRGSSLRQKGHYIIALIVPLLRLSLERAEDLAEAMENRGYQVGQARTPLYSQALRSGDWLLIAVTCLTLVVQLIGG